VICTAIDPILPFPCLPILPSQKGIEVLHYANKGTVNGPAIDTNADTRSKETTNLASLVAFPAPTASGDRSAAAASKLKVGPGVLEAAYKTGMKRVFANHWVVAAGKKVGAGGDKGEEKCKNGGGEGGRGGEEKCRQVSQGLEQQALPAWWHSPLWQQQATATRLIARPSVLGGSL
jgi:hypothetical protein